MLNDLLCLGGIAFISIGSIWRIISLKKETRYYREQWVKWEHEYWLLRTSEAVDRDGYDIHLSWLPRGDENNITKRT